MNVKKCKKAIVTLLAATMLLGAVPAYAVERTEMPDYFRIGFDAEKVTTGYQFTMGYGRYKGPSDGNKELYGSVTVGDDYYYSIETDGQITVTNANPSSTGFVYICCDVGHPLASFVDLNGDPVTVPGGYFADVDEDRYYLGADGQWEVSDYGILLVSQVMGIDGERGTMLSPGQSCTFTLPQDGTDASYLLYFYYYDPETTILSDNYTAFQRNVFRYEDTGTVAGFTDVYATDYYADAVVWAKDNGVTSGTSATTFSPGNTVTRAQAVTFLWRAAGSPQPASAVSPFVDVTDPSAYYYDAVLWAAEQGITGGVGDNRFSLDGTLTYDQILAMLCRAAGETASGSDWSDAAISWAAANGLTDGLTFAAKGSCPRSDLIYCLWKQLA